MTAFYYFLRSVTKPAYRIRGIGLGRLCELVRRWAARHAPQQPLQIDDFRGRARFNCFLREHMGGQIFFRGSYSGEQLTLLETLLTVDGVFLDVGANQGEFSIAAAGIVRQGKVIAFEPVTEYRARLHENIRLNSYTNIQVVPAALGEHSGSLPIYDRQELFEDGTRNEGLPSLFLSGSRPQVREVVSVRTLDDVLSEMGMSRVDLIKLDIEGAEWMALRGATKSLTRWRPTLILEIGAETCRAAGYEPQALAEWIAGLNYRIEKITEDGNTVPIGADELGNFQNIVAYPI